MFIWLLPACEPVRRFGEDDRDILLRPAAIVGLLAIALIHFLDLFGTLKSHAYIGVLYMVLIAACIVAADGLLGRQPRRAWMLAGAVAAAAFLAYVASRSVGLPGAPENIGNWTEPLGLAALFVEFLVTAISLRALAPERSEVRRAVWSLSGVTDRVPERAGTP
jgi:hypothetical protein